MEKGGRIGDVVSRRGDASHKDVVSIMDVSWDELPVNRNHVTRCGFDGLSRRERGTVAPGLYGALRRTGGRHDRRLQKCVTGRTSPVVHRIKLRHTKRAQHIAT